MAVTETFTCEDCNEEHPWDDLSENYNYPDGSPSMYMCTHCHEDRVEQKLTPSNPHL